MNGPDVDDGARGGRGSARGGEREVDEEEDEDARDDARGVAGEERGHRGRGRERVGASVEGTRVGAPRTRRSGFVRGGVQSGERRFEGIRGDVLARRGGNGARGEDFERYGVDGEFAS